MNRARRHENDHLLHMDRKVVMSSESPIQKSLWVYCLRSVKDLVLYLLGFGMTSHWKCFGANILEANMVKTVRVEVCRFGDPTSIVSAKMFCWCANILLWEAIEAPARWVFLREIHSFVTHEWSSSFEITWNGLWQIMLV